MTAAPDPETQDRQRHGLRFDAAADDYEQGRPGYPPETIAEVAAALALPADATVLEVGAGTGKLTRVLTGQFRRVVAVEPLAGMRQVLTDTVPAAEVRAGTAEELPLADGSADAVFVASALHWFDLPRALAEMARVLRPGGGLVLAWHENAEGLEPALPEEARALVQEAFAEGGEPGGPRLQRLDWRAALAASPFAEPQGTEVAQEMLLDHHAVVANVLSISSVAGLPEQRRAALRARLREAVPASRYRRRLRLRLYWTRRG